MSADVWYIPVSQSQVLIYAPFHGISTLVNHAMAETVSACLGDVLRPIPENVSWIETLRKEGVRPDRKRGEPDPIFLGLIPTRGCMMQCAYCDFFALRNHPRMSYEIIREAVDGYAEIMQKNGTDEWNIHFFGGEPFAAYKEIVFAVNYARMKAAVCGASVHFEVTTNGFYSEEKAYWIAENIDTVVLSLDGFPHIQNGHRPGPGGEESFPTVCRSADIFSKGPCELIIRSCVSAANAGQLAEWAAFLADRWTVEAVCLEPMIESPLARKHGLQAPDAGSFARNWAAAYNILKKEKIPLVYSSGDISALKNSLCPMGRDALIVTPEGLVGSCWQLFENQTAGGVDLHFGAVKDGSLRINAEVLEKQRERSEENREHCRGCFCYAHCAGGCMVNRDRNGDFCRMTKTLTLWQLFEQLGCHDQADALLENEDYQVWLTGQDDFRNAAIELPDAYSNSSSPVRSYETEPGNWKPFLKKKELPPLPLDSDWGWFRDESRIITADINKEFVKVLEREESLKFQLEHSGMNKSDIASVWFALHEGKN